MGPSCLRSAYILQHLGLWLQGFMARFLAAESSMRYSQAAATPRGHPPAPRHISLDVNLMDEIEIVLLLLFVVAGLTPLARRVGVPYPVLLVLAGLVLAL